MRPTIQDQETVPKRDLRDVAMSNKLNRQQENQKRKLGNKSLRAFFPLDYSLIVGTCIYEKVAELTVR